MFLVLSIRVVIFRVLENRKQTDFEVFIRYNYLFNSYFEYMTIVLIELHRFKGKILV